MVHRGGQQASLERARRSTASGWRRLSTWRCRRVPVLSTEAGWNASSAVSAVLLDTHVVHWWSADPQRVSGELDQVEELAVAAISWFELAFCS